MTDTTSTPPSAFGALETTAKLTKGDIDARAKGLLAELSFEEKLGLMSGDAPFWTGLATMSAPRGYSSRPWVAGAVERLGIPGIRFADGPRGIVLEGGTTFPVTMARGATFDPALEERVGDVIGRELRALGGNFFGGVCVNLLRHPAWGRAQETYGEDSHHLGVLGAALATGVQRHVMACVKHYALNSMENARQVVDVTADERALHEVYLPHFRRVVDAGVAAVMSAYNSVNGEWAGQDRALLNDILKEEWGFAGFVITDFITGMRDARKAALAGQDIEMPFRLLYHRDLKGLVESGEVPAERIDDAALRILRQEVRFGQGRDPSAYGPAVVGSDAHRAVAREVAEKSIVLLRNEDAFLPLAGARRIMVIGRLAATPNTGDGGSSNTRASHVVTPLEGLRATYPNAVEYDDGSDAAAAAERARSADAVVLVVGYTHDDEGEYIPPDQLAPFAHTFPEPLTPEDKQTASRVAHVQEGGFSPGGDRTRLTLHPRDEALIEAVAAANPRTVVAVMAGSAVIMEAWREKVPAILMLWYPGQEGGHALSDILSGKVNPSGRLPCTFPARAEDLPFFDRDAAAIAYDLWHGYRKFDRDGTAPAYPFGFGLGYTDFVYARLRIENPVIPPFGTAVATVEVTNIGAVAGEEVVQLYVSAQASIVERAKKEFKAFARVALEPGETKSVRLEVAASSLAFRDKEAGFVVEPIEYEIIVGKHARDEAALKSRFRIV